MNGMSPNAHWKAKLLCPIFEKCCSHTFLPEARMELWMLSFLKNQPSVHTDRKTKLILVYFFPTCWMLLKEPLGNKKKAEVFFRVYSKFLRTYNKPANRQLKRKPKSADCFSRHPNSFYYFMCILCVYIILYVFYVIMGVQQRAMMMVRGWSTPCTRRNWQIRLP